VLLVLVLVLVDDVVEAVTLSVEFEAPPVDGPVVLVVGDVVAASLEPPADSEPHAVNTLNASTCPNARTKHSVLLILVSSPCWNGDRTTGALLPSLGNVRDGVFVEVVASAVLNQEINGGLCCWIDRKSGVEGQTVGIAAAVWT